jgi:hypothetical protein
MRKQVVAVAFIRQRRAAVNTRRGGEVGRCSEADHSPSAQEATRAAQVESALGSDPADVRTCRDGCLSWHTPWADRQNYQV